MKIYKHIAKKTEYRCGYRILPDTIYYASEFGLLHRTNGPAIIRTSGEEIWFQEGFVHRLSGPAIIWYHEESPWQSGACVWCVRGKRIMNSSPIESKWELIKANPENIFAFKNPEIELQEYVIIHRPDLINQIPNLDLDLKEKYSYEMNLSVIDI
jgi:hypothetical protein